MRVTLKYKGNKTSGMVLVTLLIIMFMSISIQSITASDKDPGQRVIIDMAGREVVIPAKINKIFSVNNTGTIFMYCMAPEKMVGWNSRVNKNMRKYITDDVVDLPVLGTLYGNSSSKASIEEIMLLDPDIIIFVTTGISEKIIDNAEQIEEKMKIPVVVIDSRLEIIIEALRFFGGLIAEEDKAEILAKFVENIFKEVNAVKPFLDEDSIVSVYYARGDNGLITELKGSLNTEILRFIGANNIAELDIKRDNNGKGGNYKISKEQLLIWDPDLIIVGGGFYTESELYNNIQKDNKWQSLKAVRSKEVYFVPAEPFNWFDRPPSLNKIIGIVWAVEIIYPELYKFNIRKEVKEFYSLFYNYDLDEKDLNVLLNYRLK